MGWGDEIMALGEAQRLHLETGRRVRIVGAAGRPRTSEIWAGEPSIASPREPDDAVAVLRNGPGHRPYLRSPLTRDGGAKFSGWRARDHAARLHLTADELHTAATLRQRHGGFVVIEPNLDRNANPNKQWGKWQALADRQGLSSWPRFVQLGQPGTPILGGVLHIATESFRDGCAALSAAHCAVLPEGGLHHAAAALGIPAVVIFGGHTPVETTGYPEHINLALGEACGSWRPCDHCAAAMAAISVNAVAGALDRILCRPGE